MIERRELEKLKEVIEYSMPQIADYNPRSGRYSIELAMTKHIDLGEGDHHILFAQGYLNRVGGKRSSFLPTFVFRPLTPPYVRFRIRRFLFWIPFEIRLH